ncbi:hypothetical protein Nizo1840_0709 [Lactiplantibacillus plantarum]|nr:hypothetical protein Nizo1840_0709 [Lactiplantibacillus plantarum]
MFPRAQRRQALRSSWFSWSGLGETQGFKKGSSAVFADLSFWVLKATFFVAFFLS